MINRLLGGDSIDVIHLDSGVDLEAQLRQLNPRKRRKWYMRMSRQTWFIVGIVITLMFLCGGVYAALPLLIRLTGGG